MKVIFLLPILAYLVIVQCDLEGDQVGDNLKKDIPTWHDDCKILSGVTEETINSLRKGKFDGNDGEDTKKYLTCILLQSKAFDAHFKVNKTIVDYYLPQTISDDVFPKYLDCAKEARELEDEFEDKVWSFFKCYYEADPEHFILP